MQRIIVIQDENVAFDLSNKIKNIGFEVIDCISDIEVACQLIMTANIDIVIIDKKSSYLLNKLQDFIMTHSLHNISIYITYDEITNNKHDIRGFVIKPLAISELNHSAICLHTTCNAQKNLGNGYKYNLTSSQLSFDNAQIHLTRREKILLELFIKEKNQLVSTEKILYCVWNDKVVSDKTIRTLIKQLNDKFNFNFITNIYGQGYKTLTIE